MNTNKKRIRTGNTTTGKRLAAAAIVVLTVCALAASGGVSGAAASPSATATGTYTVTGAVVESVRTAGGQTFTTYSLITGVYAGDLSGPFEIHDVVVHTASTGLFIGSGKFVCTSCTIGGRTGDFVGELSNTSPGPKMGGIVTVLSATGGLAGLHAVNHFEGSPFAGNYSYSYHFEP